MTIEYKDSKRIVTLEADVATTEEVYAYTTTQSTNEKLSGTAQAYSAERAGVELVSSIFAGKYIKTGKWNLKRVGTLGSNAFMKVEDSSGTVKGTSTGVAASGIGTSAYEDVTFTLPTPVELANGDRVYVQYTGTDGSGNYLAFGEKHPSTTPTGWEFTIYNKHNSSGGSPSGAWGDDGLATALVPVATFDSAPSSNKPTDVQDNSLLVEKDTARRYWFKDASSNTTYEDDFSSVWTTVGTGSNGTIYINSDGELLIDTVVGNSDTRVYKALGFTLADDWTARWEQTMKGTTDNNVYMQVMNFTAGNNNLNAGTNQDSVHMITDSNNQTIYIRSKDGTTAGNQQGSQSLTTGTKYYMEFVKDGTGLTLKIRTGSHSGTLVNTLTTTCSSGITGLTHIQTGGATGTNSGAASYSFDNIEIWNDATSASGTATFTENFSDTKIWQADGDDVIMGTNVLDWASVADGGEDLCYKDLTSVNDSKWVAEFDVTFDTVTSGSDTDGAYFMVYLGSKNTNANVTGHDALGITYELDNSPSNQASIGAFSCDNKNLYDAMKFNSGTGARSVFNETAQASETQYVRMMRDESTFTVEIYSDSTRQTLVESQSVDANNGGTVSGLRYFVVATTRDNAGDHTFDGKVDNVKFYNGVSTPTTWTMNPTYEDDFSTNKGWVTQYASKMAYNATTKKLDPVKYENSNNGDNMTMAKELDFTLDTSFVVRFVLDFSQFGNSPFITMGVSDKDSTVNADTAQDYLGIVCHNGSTWSAQVKDNTELGTFTNIGQASWSGHQSNFGTDYYCELIRNGDSFTINIRTGSHTGTSVVTATTTISTIGTVSNLKYIKFGSYDATSSAGYCTTTIDDLLVYNGVNTVN